MEIGSFIELQLPNGKEFYAGNLYHGMDIVRLNSGRAAIWHAFRITKCDAIWIPYYQCESVRDYLIKKDVLIYYYHIDENFNPIDLNPQANECVLLVNYFGVMSYNRMSTLAKKYGNIIVDNSQAFFAKPIHKCLNVYSCRKFIGVPDGAYVIGKNVNMFMNEYEQGYSSDTSLFLLQRIEYGCAGKTYATRKINEDRIDCEDIKKMSMLTYHILDATNYDEIIHKRRCNYEIACELFDGINKLYNHQYYADDCIPMVYPLLIEDEGLLQFMLKNKHYQGHWWEYLTDELDESCFEYYLSRYMVPITIDQRYGRSELLKLRGIIDEYRR